MHFGQNERALLFQKIHGNDLRVLKILQILNQALRIIPITEKEQRASEEMAAIDEKLKITQLNLEALNLKNRFQPQ